MQSIICKKQNKQQTTIVHISLSHHHQQLEVCHILLSIVDGNVSSSQGFYPFTFHHILFFYGTHQQWEMLIKMQQISYYSWASKCVLLLIKAITSFLYIFELLGIVFLLVSSCNKVLMGFFYGCLFLQACAKVCRILYKIGVQFPHKLLDLQHLDVFVFAQPTCEICYTCEVSFLNATMCVVQWHNLE